jgi:hypothetical protein
MRTRMPFIEALRKQQQEAGDLKPVSSFEVERDLSPKSMADSYHRVVSRLDPNCPLESDLMGSRLYL